MMNLTTQTHSNMTIIDSNKRNRFREFMQRSHGREGWHTSIKDGLVGCPPALQEMLRGQ